jgi:hypothetical protein
LPLAGYVPVTAARDTEGKEDTHMTDKPKFENLELNKETIQELTESDAEAGRGGLRAGPPESACAKGWVSWSHNYCPDTK